MARRRGFTTGFNDARTCRDDIERTVDDTDTLQQFPAQEHTYSGKKGGHRKMPLTQEKHLDSNFTNNNDNSYLHKKFKKMATTISMSSSNPCKDNENINIDCNIANNDSDTSISNGSIAASHPEIEKIKEKSGYTIFVSRQEGNVQTTFNDKNNRLSDVNIEQHNGKTSFSNEFSNKTENIDNDFIKDVSIGTSGRYICPYCKLSCAKPSVLQKHIRAHTNERPYPCVPCGFAFKTKSNLYKHRRSRTHALRLQGADVPVTNEDDLSADSESDNSLPPTSTSDAGSDVSTIRSEVMRPCELSSPELLNDRNTPPTGTILSSDGSAKSKTIYKPKFRAALYQEIEEKERNVKPLSANAEFLNEHISKIISDNEAIVDVLETPLQKKYGKIKQIAESKQLHQINQNNELKRESSPLNLTKSGEVDSFFRKRSHSDTFSNIDYHKHPLNPEGSIIKDLLLKTKGNGLTSVTSEMVELTPLFICPLCQIPYRSADNLETHRLHYCKGSNSSIHKEFVRSNSINVRLPEVNSNSSQIPQTITRSPPLKSKPENLILIKPESSDIATPLPSPGPLLGHTRLVDTRGSSDYSRKPELKLITSPKRRLENRSDNYSPRLADNMSPRGIDSYSYPKLRCLESTSRNSRINDDYSQSPLKQNASLQMFGGEVKIHQSGSTTTLRIEPSKNQLSPILVPGKNSETESSIVLRSGIHSGGTVSIQNQTPKMSITTSTLNVQSTNTSNMHEIPHFQFPPLSAITAFNPLTLPPLSPSTPNGSTSILHGGKIIPHVPGMPGPNTAALFMGTSNNPLKITLNENSFDSKSDKKSAINSKNHKSFIKYEEAPRNSKITHADSEMYSMKNIHNVDKQPRITTVKVKRIEEISTVSPKIIISNTVRPSIITPIKRSIDGTPKQSILKESVNYTQNKSKSVERTNVNSINKNLDIRTPENEMRNFNFETLITKAEIYNNQIPSPSDVQKNINEHTESNSSTIQNERSETSYFQKNSSVNTGTDERRPKFLRPSTLALKPGTFTPKRHHGITPNANTMPLVSPETPRPAKAYGQLYLNGNAYTYLGLKCSTKVFYCTINRPQPTYVPNQHFLSMYSNWQLLSELTPDPLGLTTSLAMSLYDSRHRPQNTVVSKMKQDLILTHSSQWNKNSRDPKHIMMLENKRTEDKLQSCDEVVAPKKELAGGFESNEEYTYIRGRGRGRYVCSECGIRCKKPSMLKKHIRTHTDVRPFTCTHCAFSFKTKGNLTKHMKSKAHYKKCCELGINPNEGTDLDGGDPAQCSGETDDESDSDGDEGNEGETESSDTEICKSRLPEHEAAHCLLSLGGSRPATSGNPGLITSARPSTYPYTPIGLEAAAQRSVEISVKNDLTETRTEDENEPMDLSKNDMKIPMPEIPTARESSVLASLASNTAKLPQQTTQWSNGEPMLHAYLTERALLDSKIKQSQLTSSSLSKLRKDDKTGFDEGKNNMTFTTSASREPIVTSVAAPSCVDTPKDQVFEPNQNLVSNNVMKPISKVETSNDISVMSSTNLMDKKASTEGNAENVKFVVSEYLKLARVNVSEIGEPVEFPAESTEKRNVDFSITEETPNDSDCTKSSLMDHEPVARKVVIGAGGVAFKVTKGKEYEGNMASYAPGRLMEDGRRVCDFCNKTFTKPSQLRLHLNIHYMERPFRCSACAVSFRTRGHLQKHERSGSHHNKVSMTSTFGAATSLNPRPFRCSDCNIAFRIHGHLAKHLRSKMHVMRLECLYKLPFGTFTEIERAGVSLTDIDTTDCASSLASLQMLAQKLHEMDPSKLEYREPSLAQATSATPCKDSSDEEDTMALLHSERISESEKDKSDNKTVENSHEEMRVIFSATDN